MKLEKYLNDLGKYKRFLYIGLALAVVFDFLAPRHHEYFFWDKIPGFSAVFGFISAVLIIFVSKGIGHAFLMKHEEEHD